MWPHSLLFSSDEEASRSLSRAFRDLEFEVETCPEIFSAVEKITRRSFDVVVSDWNEGLEAVFLLKTVRELKANQLAFTIAIASAEAADAAREAGADLVLSRPLVPDQVKYALLTSDAFLAQMKSWLPRMGQAPDPKAATPEAPRDRSGDHSTQEGFGRAISLQSHKLRILARLRAWPSPPPPRRTEKLLRRWSPRNRFLTTTCCIDRGCRLCFGRPSRAFRRPRHCRKRPKPCAARFGDRRSLSLRGLCIQRTAARTRHHGLSGQDVRARAGADAKRGCIVPMKPEGRRLAS